jgi:hypothetical protein
MTRENEGVKEPIEQYDVISKQPLIRVMGLLLNDVMEGEGV